MASLKTWLRLVRPANVVTSVADVLAGISVAGYFARGAIDFAPVLLLCFSTACLYAGGIVYNDIFDLELDRVERPERAIPSGQISLRQAVFLGSLLLIAGIISAAIFSILSGVIALLISQAALLYDKVGKHNKWLGPLNMGICRGLNLLLGLSIIPAALYAWFPIALVPVAYIYAITMISRGEVGGSGRKPLYAAMVLYLIVIATIALLAYGKPLFLPALALLLIFSLFIFRPLINAIKSPVGKNIGLAVKAGVISLIIMDASWALSFNAVYAAIFIFLLLPVSIWLSKYFAVT